MKKKGSLEIGKEFTTNVMIKNIDIERFGELTNDLHLMHFDDNFAKSKGFSKKIVQGAFLLSMAISLITHKIVGFNYLIAETKFKYLFPTYPMEKIKITFKVSKLNLKFNFAIIDIIFTSKNKINCKGSISIKLLDS